ncbi:MAG: superoxide dismutase family protein [Gemmatimonadota bacterium]
MRTIVLATAIAVWPIPFAVAGADAPLAVGPAALAAQLPPTARAPLRDAEGDVVATAVLRETPHGVLIRLRATALPPGEHGYHIHETGRCEPPTFESAGGHYAPRGREHGFLNPRGPHAGDLPNLHVPADGELAVEHLAGDVTLRAGETGTLFDDDGSALVIHARRDDYTSQPAGDSGERIACGVVRRMAR